MGKQQLARELIKMLEKEKGIPVQIIVDTPKSIRYALDEQGIEEGREYFGRFDKRPVEVRRVEGLDPKYEHDVALLEENYTNLGELQRKIESYAVVGAPTEEQKLGEVKKMEIELLKRAGVEVPERLLELEHLGKEDGIEQELEQILDQRGIRYLHHQIKARPDGLFDDRTLPRSYVNETKIADITLNLLE